jgi:hypothetical protein
MRKSQTEEEVAGAEREAAEGEVVEGYLCSRTSKATADAGGPVVRVIVLRTAEGLDAPLIGDTVVGGGTLAANRGAK